MGATEVYRDYREPRETAHHFDVKAVWVQRGEYRIEVDGEHVANVIGWSGNWTVHRTENVTHETEAAFQIRTVQDSFTARARTATEMVQRIESAFNTQWNGERARERMSARRATRRNELSVGSA